MISDVWPKKPLYVYLQRPDTGQWVTVGRYIQKSKSEGVFRYAPSYLDSGLLWEIDPVNLRLIRDYDFLATRYTGLHDVLRDACPDAWGRSIISKKQGISYDSPDVKFLIHSGNSERWGALAVGESKAPNIGRIDTPKLIQLPELVQELLALSENKQPINPMLRKRLLEAGSAGGARPKLTVKDGSEYWLVKPGLVTDTVDLALLEHATQTWGSLSNLSFAKTIHHPISEGRSLVRVKRFDRLGFQRFMCVSAASLLQVNYPPIQDKNNFRASYPMLAETLRIIGAPLLDRKELFGRMVFNAIVGNDDDHTRNHAIVFDSQKNEWRLAPAFDVVPNPDESPVRSAMDICLGKTLISRENLLEDYVKFGFESQKACAEYLEEVLERVNNAFPAVARILSSSLAELLGQRLLENTAKLSADVSPSRKRKMRPD